MLDLHLCLVQSAGSPAEAMTATQPIPLEKRSITLDDYPLDEMINIEDFDLSETDEGNGKLRR